jgi:hypothetical protein
VPAVAGENPAGGRIALAGASRPLAVDSDQVTAAPLNGSADDVPVVLFREQPWMPIVAFDRRTYDRQRKLDLIVKFAPNLLRRRHPLAFCLDLSSNSGWNAKGICVDAPAEAKYLKGKKLEPVAVDDGLPLKVIKFWYPDLNVEIAPAAPIAVETETNSDTQPSTTGHHRPRKPRVVHPDSSGQ